MQVKHNKLIFRSIIDFGANAPSKGKKTSSASNNAKGKKGGKPTQEELDYRSIAALAEPDDEGGPPINLAALLSDADVDVEITEDGMSLLFELLNIQRI